MSNFIITVGLIFPLVSILNCQPTEDPFYVIAHMANSERALHYAVLAGANAVQVDLLFRGSANPVRFQAIHNCDCSRNGKCSDNEMCNHGLGGSCLGSLASNDVAKHLKKIASYKDKIFLIIIHVEMHVDFGHLMEKAAIRTITILNDFISETGYSGDIVISAANGEQYEYMRHLTKNARKSEFYSQYFFGFYSIYHGCYTAVAGFIDRMFSGTKAVYGAGFSSCNTKEVYQMTSDAYYSRAVDEYKQKKLSFVYAWTVDDKSKMKKLINIGVQGIVTNNPRKLKEITEEMNLNLAKSGDNLPEATNLERNNQWASICECLPVDGGCRITFPAPPGYACNCGEGACKGSVVRCNPDQDCRFPDGSQKSCKLKTRGGRCTSDTRIFD